MSDHYGFFVGGDPRDFTPGGGDDCTREEIENWRKECEKADEVDAREHVDSALEADGQWLTGEIHATVCQFGLGVNHAQGTGLWRVEGEAAYLRILEGVE